MKEQVLLEKYIDAYAQGEEDALELALQLSAFKMHSKQGGCSSILNGD